MVVKLELLLTNIDMLLVVEKGVIGGILHAIRSDGKANNKHMKNYGKNIESSYPMYLDASNLYGWEMSTKLPVNGSKSIQHLSKFDEDCIKNYDVDIDKR